MTNLVLSFTKDGQPMINGAALKKTSLSGDSADVYTAGEHRFSININHAGSTDMRVIGVVDTFGKPIHLTLDPVGYENLNTWAAKNSINVQFVGYAGENASLAIPVASINPGALAITDKLGLKLNKDHPVVFNRSDKLDVVFEEHGYKRPINVLIDSAEAAIKVQGNRYLGTIPNPDQIRQQLTTDLQMEVAMMRGAGEQHCKTVFGPNAVPDARSPEAACVIKR